MWRRYAIVAVLSVVVGCFSMGLIPSAFAGMATYYFPHVADGRNGNTYYTSEFLFNNVQSTATVVTLSFFTDTGSAWPVGLRSLDRPELTDSRTSFNFTLQPYETVNFYTGTTGALATGWAVVRTSQTLVTSSAFTMYEAGSQPKILWQAGVLPSPPATEVSFEANLSKTVDVFAGVGADTGFAIGNPSGEDATITVSLLPHGGGAPVGVEQVAVPHGGHKAMFLAELFYVIFRGDTFHGTVRFSSNVGVSIMGLKRAFGGGNDVYSSLAVQPETELKRNIVYDTEDNSSFVLAQPITAPVEIVGTSNYPDNTSDLDYFAVDLLAGQTLHVILLAEMIGSPLHASLTLFDPSRNQIAYSDNALPEDRDPSLSYTVVNSGIFFIRLGSVNGSSSRGANYRMFVLIKR